MISKTPKKAEKKTEKPANYHVDNDQFFELLRGYLKQRKRKKDLRVPEDIGKIMDVIVTKFANHPFFKSYTFKDLMISEARKNCIKYIDRFDPTMISKRTGRRVSPLAYFTQVAYHSFIKIISDEAKHSRIKDRLCEEFIIHNYSARQISINDEMVDLYKTDHQSVSEWLPMTVTIGRKKRTFKTRESYQEHLTKTKNKILYDPLFKKG